MIWLLQNVFGLFVDATVGQLFRALSGPSLPYQPPRPSLPAAPAAPPAISLPAESWRHVEPEPPLPDPVVRRDQDLSGGDVKLVRYSIVSLRHRYERLIATGYEVVTDSMTRESFATWVVASTIELRDQRMPPIPPADLRYLRVEYEVLERWPRREKDCCDDSQTEALREILGTLRSFSAEPVRPAPPAPPGPPGPPERPPEPAPPPPVQTLVWDGSGTPSQVGARGQVVLIRTWNGAGFDVTLEGTLSIRSRSFGHVRHALPPGFLPVSTDPRAGTCEVQRHATLGDTTGMENYGGWGVHVRRGDFPGYEGRATLWFPERTSGEYTLRCTWQTLEVPPS